MTVKRDSRNDLCVRLASITQTERSDWFVAFKARHALQVVFDAAHRVTGRDVVITQLFTCVTAVDPIVAAGLVPHYVDILPDTLAIDPSQVRADEHTCAVVAQHTFGIIDAQRVAQLREVAHEAGALLVEDCAHCLGRMARDEQGRPLADVSIHSFGVEKMLPGVYFGGAVWISPELSEDVRKAIVAAFEALPPLPRALDRATRRYRNQMRLFTRVPHGLSVRMRTLEASHGTFEPAVSEAEQRGQVAHEPLLPSEWVARQAFVGLDGLPANEDNRRACMAAYLRAFEQLAADDDDLFIPASVRDVAADQPLLRFPVFFRSTAIADKAISAVIGQGHYAQSWPRPLLLPGVLDPAAYGLEQGTGAWPVSERLSAGVVGLPTDIDSAAVPAVAQAMLSLAQTSPTASSEEPSTKELSMANPVPNIDLIQSEADLPARLQPVVCGADILGYTYVRCYQDAYGIRPIVLSSIDVKITSSSKLCDYRVVPGLNDEQGFLDAVVALGKELVAAGKVPILHGSADWNTRIISAHKDELAQWYVVPYIDFALLDDITQKRRFYEICEELSIPYPQTWYLRCPHEHEPLDTSQFPYPLIAKPSNSAAWDAIEFAGKKKIYEIETPEELEQAFEAVCASPYEHDLIIQDFVPGGDDAIRSLTTFSDEQGQLRVVSGGRVALQDHSPLALGNPVCILGERVDEIINSAEKFLAHVQYHGYANFDIKYDSRDGSYRFFEVNTRPGKNTFYVTLGGYNYVKPIVEQYVLRREVPKTYAYQPFLYTVVPPKVVRRSVDDDALRADVLAAYRDGRATNPLDNPRDGLVHKLWVTLYTQNQVRKFKRYLWDTGGKQADVS